MKLGDKVIDLRGNVGVGDNAAISKPALACPSKKRLIPACCSARPAKQAKSTPI